MLFSINPSDGLTIYDQIIRQVKFAIASGAIEPGEWVPSVRELSKEIAVNPNTVVRAYRDLTDAGVLEAIRGTGLQVSASAPQHCRQERRELIRERIRLTLEEAKLSQLTADEIRTLFEKELTSLETGRSARRNRTS